MKYEITYFEKPGKVNTQRTIGLAVKRAEELNIEHIVVATCTGYSAKVLLQKAKDKKIVVVTHQAGFAKPGEMEIKPNVIEFLKNKGAKVYTGTHFFGGFGRAIRFKFGGLEPEEIAANTLRIFGEGIKVAVEIAIMALDAGLIPYGKEIISIGGTGSGVDTAIVCVPRHGKDFFNFEVREIICKPRRR
ncbi:MAG: pyruvate kinase alpha/beta domain-containing protein [candidate division WOR-3 bacterium]